MTKKHFIALADAIRECRPIRGHENQSDFGKGYDYGREQQYNAMVERLEEFCVPQNHQFNRERWLAYIAGECGPNGGAIKPPCKPRMVTPERRLARRLEGKEELRKEALGL